MSCMRWNDTSRCRTRPERSDRQVLRNPVPRPTGIREYETWRPSERRGNGCGVPAIHVFVEHDQKLGNYVIPA